MQRLILTIFMLISLTSIAAKPVYLSGLLIQPSATASRFIFILSEKNVWKSKISSE